MASDACLITAPTVSDFIDPQRTVNAHNHNGTQLGVLALAASVRRRGGTVQIIDTTQLILDALRAGNGMKHQSDYALFAAHTPSRYAWRRVLNALCRILA
jgi:hypothetical protein